MKRRTTTVVLVAALALLAAAVGGFTRGTASAGTAASARADATTLTVWVGWSARELNEFKKVVAEYDAKNPNVEVKVVGGINDDKIIAALRSGNGPDVVSSFTSSNVGLYCSSGGWIDLAPYLKREQHRHEPVPGRRRATTRSTRASAARCRCSPTCTASTTTRTLFKKAGLTRPAEDDAAADRSTRRS